MCRVENYRHNISGVVEPDNINYSYSDGCGEKHEVVESLVEGVLRHAYENGGAIPFDSENEYSGRLRRMGVESAFLDAVTFRARKMGASRLVVGKNEQSFVALICEERGQPIEVGFVFEEELKVS